MSLVNEHDFEQELIELIKNKLNWNYFNSEEISKEQINYSNNGFYYLHKNKFENSIKKLNPNIEEQYINKAISKVKTIISGTNLDISAKEAFNFLIKGIKIDNNDKNKSTLVIKLIDFENIKNNDFSFTNQLKVKTSDPNKKIQIPDVIFYINGLPVIVGELKNPIIEYDNWFEKALNQINNYKKYCHISLFSFNFLNFISNKEISKYSSVTNDNADYYFWWKKMDKKNKNLEWDFFFEKLLNPKILFDLFCNFSYYPNNDKFKNKRTLASYHQFYGTNDSVEKAKNSFENNDNKIGIYWHTQGSGKSQSMIFFAHKMIKKYPKLTTLVITDRKDLDGQLYFTFQ